MPRIVKIESCDECPHSVQNDNKMYCDLTDEGMSIFHNLAVTDKCPLPDTKTHVIINKNTLFHK